MLVDLLAAEDRDRDRQRESQPRSKPVRLHGRARDAEFRDTPYTRTRRHVNAFARLIEIYVLIHSRIDGNGKQRGCARADDGRRWREGARVSERERESEREDGCEREEPWLNEEERMGHFVSLFAVNLQ